MTRQPTRPTFGWDNLGGEPSAGLPAVDDLPDTRLLSSGRAALFAAMKALGVQPGDTVLAPSYHCPTLVAPLRLAGARVQFYPLGPDGLPALAAITPEPGTRAIVVAQLFGLPRSLAAVRAWCDARGIALVEDCAHSFFGQAGERPVGRWGDLATASVSKFFPVTEGGLLAGARPLPAQALRPAGAKQQLKAWVDLLERASEQGRLAGLNTALRALFRLKNGSPKPPGAPRADGPSQDMGEPAMMADCDLARSENAPPALTRQLLALPRRRIVERRRAHYETLHRLTQNLPGTRPLFGPLPAQAAPYVMPLWVDSPEAAETVYAALRAAGCAVFRWDRVWPGVPEFPNDHGALWRTQLLQLLCHQDLTEPMLARTCDVLTQTLATLPR
ncbi:DegT/DnrJ/EryC1/StrS family aminotransferase [Roseateles saccharophilus]|uniref:dTDP-4-amino-4,6-dideoxygalactose transaminase n=1 Tax=Roseateles saccharophilus TaxID=304 RepID=A0A4R3UIF8_ROSSA|nr:DegT/DnrJ/EryC1/StrS family aminotransferase [Roseateles saccharophilus]MDG0834468.1 DegT/DnrJ/EryC1/StrS aminotransferase family protein [Roseateles saccharophilus]TCU89756.1 dTDP-4-amino-4,6-dideoxygalactose transaminase [Roseateles saccharophilus]